MRALVIVAAPEYAAVWPFLQELGYEAEHALAYAGQDLSGYDLLLISPMLSKRSYWPLPVVGIIHHFDEVVDNHLLYDGVVLPTNAQRLSLAIRSAQQRYRMGEALARFELQYFRSEERFLSIILNNLDAMLVVDKEGKILFANPAAENLFEQEALEGQAFGFPIVEGETSELAVRRREGDNPVVEMRVSTTTWESEPAFLLTLHDISARKRTENALRESLLENLRLATAIDHAEVGVTISDPNQAGNPLIYANLGFLKMTGYTIDETIGRNCRYLQGPETDPAVLQQIRDSLAERIPFRGILLNYRKDGSTFWNELFIAPILDDGGKLLYFVGLQSDVSVQFRLQEEVRRTERMQVELEQEAVNRRMRMQFVSMVSHEFRTPLAIIRSSSDILKQYYERLDDARRKHHLASIDTSIDRLTSLLNDVLTIFRMETIGPSFEPSRINLDVLLHSVLADMHVFLTAKHQLDYVNHASELAYFGDGKLLAQAFSNLIGNAIKYSPDGGQVLVEVHALGEGLQVTISDEGIGIPADLLPNLFRPFQRGDNVGNLPGTGLGLAIAHQAIELHHGTIHVSSTPGQGTRMEVFLPVLFPQSMSPSA